MKNVTLKDVAKAAGVSYATVSRALSGSSQIGSETRERVLKLCDEMGYTTNFVARSMVTKRTNLIGLVVPSVDNQFMSELAYHAEVSARAHGKKAEKPICPLPPLARETNPGAVQAQRPGFCIFGSRSRGSGKWNGKKTAK